MNRGQLSNTDDLLKTNLKISSHYILVVTPSASLAQMAERWPFKPVVAGSSPAGGV